MLAGRTLVEIFVGFPETYPTGHGPEVLRGRTLDEFARKDFMAEVIAG